MSQIIKQQNPFEFFPGTDEDAGEFVCDVAIMGEEMFKNVEANIPSKFQIVPTRTMIVMNAADNYEMLLYQYAMNGNSPMIKQEIEEGMEDGLTGEDLMEMWMEWRHYNASFYSHNVTITEDTERMFIRDVVRALDVYHISHFSDNAADSPYTDLTELKVGEWKNAPFLEVW